MDIELLYLCEPGWERNLNEELQRVFPGSDSSAPVSGSVRIRTTADDVGAVPCVALAFQCLPDYQPVSAPSISQWARNLVTSFIEGLHDHEGPWRLHIISLQGNRDAPSKRRCQLIAEAVVELLRKKQRRLLRSLVTDFRLPWNPGEALAQAALTTTTDGFVSLCTADRRQSLRRCICRFPAGEVAVPADRLAPSRAFQKLAEVELRMAQPIAPGESCVDLGSSPGSWAWLALKRGASVTAVDRSPLRQDLMHHPKLTFLRGDAFQYGPAAPVDWLLCDVIAFPEKTIQLLRAWLDHRWCRRFCVTLKFRGTSEYDQLEAMKRRLVGSGAEFELRRLTHNKNEVTAFGTKL